MRTGTFRFAVGLSLLLAAAMVAVATSYHLPIRDPDGVQVKTFIRLPIILLLTWLVDVVPRAVVRARGVRGLLPTLRAVVVERWPRQHIRYAVVGLGAWYLTYVAFRNLKSYVPFVHRKLFDGALERFDRTLFLGHDPADVLHQLLGTSPVTAQLMSFVYIAWIALLPASLVVALVWSRDPRAGEWYVTAVAVDWVLGVATYFAVPTLGPIYAHRSSFADLPNTWVSSLQETMIDERYAVLTDPMSTGAVQSIAAFASLHVGIAVTAALMAELLDLPRWVRASLWVFLGLTALCTVYLGWHYVADVIGGAVLGSVAVLVAAWGTGNHARGIPVRLSRENRRPAVARPR